MSFNRYGIQERSIVTNEWLDMVCFTDITSAVAEYKYLTNENPNTSYRIIEIHEVSE